MRERRVTVAVLVAGLAIPLAACGSSSGGSSTSSGAKKTYVVGVSDDLSGPEAFYGTGLRKVWTAVYDRVNASGGINGHKVRLVFLDNRSDPSNFVANERQLASQGALVIAGMTDSDACAAVSTAASRDSISTLCNAAPNTLVSPPKPDPNVFSTSTPELQFASSVTKLLTEQVGHAPKVGLLVVDVVGEHTWEKTFKQLVPAAGGSIVADETLPLSQLSTPTSQTARILASHPEAVVAEIAPAGFTSLVHGLRNGGFTGPIVNLTSDYTTLTTLKDPKVFEVSLATLVTPTATGAGAKQYLADFAKAGLSGVVALNGGTVGVDWLGAQAVAQALANCGGTCTKQSVRSTLEKTVIQEPGVSINPGFGYTTTRHSASENFAVYSWDASKQAPALVNTLPVVAPEGS
jgi:branched-chain amino acid transport system substrate-binding protein